MGDTNDGSSSAAQSAREVESDPSKPGLSFFDRIFGRKPKVDDTPQSFGSPEDIAAASQGARAMLVNVSRLGSLRVSDIAVPRADIVSIPDTSSLEEVVEAFRESALTRLPVFDETLDNPVGMIHLKDVALNHGFGRPADGFAMKDLVRPLLYAPPSMPIGVLFQKMQSDRTHMALVIDEYGGVDGLVTIEDLLEQVVGDIADEHDADEGDLWTVEATGCYLAYSRAPLEDFEKVAGVDLLPDDLDEEVDTLGGLVFMLAGRVPLRGEVVVHPDGHEFEVMDADPRRVKRVRVRLKLGTRMDQAAE